MKGGEAKGYTNVCCTSQFLGTCCARALHVVCEVGADRLASVARGVCTGCLFIRLFVCEASLR